MAREIGEKNMPERSKKKKRKTIDFEGFKRKAVNPDAVPLTNPDTGDVLSEAYEKNPDIELEFGEKDGNVVIRSIKAPAYYDDTQLKQMADYGRKNIGNCPICEKYEKFLSDFKKNAMLEARKSFDTWVVDIKPDQKHPVRRITGDKENDVAVGYGYDRTARQMYPKKLAFSMDRFSKQDALKESEELLNKLHSSAPEGANINNDEQKTHQTGDSRQDASTRMGLLPRPDVLPRPVRRSGFPKIRKGLFPNITEWRRERKRLVD